VSACECGSGYREEDGSKEGGKGWGRGGGEGEEGLADAGALCDSHGVEHKLQENAGDAEAARVLKMGWSRLSLSIARSAAAAPRLFHLQIFYGHQRRALLPRVTDAEPGAQ
jgi:hypothetical protein